MPRLQTFWCPSPGDDDDRDRNWLKLELTDDWYATDGDRAILPVRRLDRNGETPAEVEGLLVQFGGSDIVLDMKEAGIEPGDEFIVINPRSGRPYIDEASAIPD